MAGKKILEPPDRDAAMIPKLKAELDKKMPGYIRGKAVEQVWKHPMLQRNPTVRSYFKTLYLKQTGEEFRPIR